MSPAQHISKMNIYLAYIGHQVCESLKGTERILHQGVLDLKEHQTFCDRYLQATFIQTHIKSDTLRILFQQNVSIALKYKEP